MKSFDEIANRVRVFLSASVLAALAAGCATSSMKSTPFYRGSARVYTGRIEDRVNLWPIGYYREPALSVLWPLFSLTDDHLAIRPLYSQYRQGGKDSDYNEFNFLWPLCRFDTKHHKHRVFPFYWGDRHVGLFPIASWRFGKSARLFPIVWWKKDEYFDVFPLWWSHGDSRMLFPFYYQDDDSFGIFPFYYRDPRNFATLLWASGGDAADNWWAVPPLLSWGSDGLGGWSQNYLLGLGGVRRYKDGGSSDWLVPFYYRDRDVFATPLFGWSSRCGWVAPLYYRTDYDFVSLLYCRSKGWITTHAVPPLLSWMSFSGDGSKKLRFLLGLGGVNTTTNGNVDCSWMFPLYYNDDNAFISLPFGHTEEYSYVTPLFGVTHQEHRKGAWMWPLFGWANDDRMEAAEARMNASTLDPNLSIEHSSHWRLYAVKGVEDRAHDESWLLSGLSTRDRTICWDASDDGKVVFASDSRSFGNFLAVKSTSERVVEFDYKSREKISDTENGELGVFCNLLWHSKYEKVAGGRSYTKKSILWRFWHYENTDGNVSVDSFPFFTYDSKTDGYSKTSLLWRLFRNEYDPKTDRRSIDFLFIPIWR